MKELLEPIETRKTAFWSPKKKFNEVQKPIRISKEFQDHYTKESFIIKHNESSNIKVLKILALIRCLKISPNIYQSQTTFGKKKFSKSTKAWTSLLSQRKQMNEQFYDAPLHPFFFYAFWIDCQGMHFLVSVNIIHSKWSNIYEHEIRIKMG